MTTPLRFDSLRAILQQRVDQLPDCRKGRNTQYRMPEAPLGAFGLFFTQSPSFLEYQRRLQDNKGRNKGRTLFGVTKSPCDHHIRTSSIRSLRAIAPLSLLRSLSALNSTTCSTVSGASGSNSWWPWMARTTFPPKPSSVPTVSRVSSRPVTRCMITQPSPRWWCAQDARRSSPYLQRTSCPKMAITNRTASRWPANAGSSNMPRRLRRIR